MIKTIEEICKDNEIIIVDACIFMNPLNNKRFHNGLVEESIQEKVKYKTIENQTILFWLDEIPKYPQINTTSSVISEMTPQTNKKSYSKRIRQCGGNKELLELRRIREKIRKNQRKLISLLDQENRKIKLNATQEDRYKIILQKYCNCLEKSSLSETDKELLLSGATLSKKQRVGLLSNDAEIFRFWKKINSQNQNKKNFNFYGSREIGQFEKAY